jgi:hypothetical protein
MMSPFLFPFLRKKKNLLFLKWGNYALLALMRELSIGKGLGLDPSPI